jgi:hypothetical protein
MIFRASEEGDFHSKLIGFPGIIFDPSLLCNKTQWLLELQKKVICIAKPRSFLGIISAPSLLCNKTQWFLELQKRVIFTAKP